MQKKPEDKNRTNNQSKKEIINDLFTKPAQGSTEFSRLLVLSIVLSVVIGVISGLVGVTMMLSGSLANIPFFRAFTLETILPERQVIVRQQQDVTVAEDKILDSLIVKSDPTIVTFVKQGKSDEALGSIYKNSDVLGHGSILTADGWLVVLSEVLSGQAASKVRVITGSGDVYAIEDLVADKTSSTSFVKIKADNLMVTPIAENPEFKTGESLVSLTRSLPSGQLEVSKINIRNLDEIEIIQSSEELNREVAITASSQLVSAPVFNLAGELVGLVHKASNNDLYELKPAYHFMFVLPEILSGGDVKRAYLGIDWINLHGNTGLSDKIQQGLNKGAYVYDFNLDSPALVAGLEIGDIIEKVNDLELNGNLNLSELIQQHSPGETIFLSVLRGQEELEFELILEDF